MLTGLANATVPLRRSAGSVGAWLGASLVWRLGMWAAAFVAAYQGEMLLEDRRDLGRALAFLVLATLLIAAATWGLLAGERNEPGPDVRLWSRETLRSAAVPIALLAVAIGLAIAFRVFKLTELPFGVWFDEAQNGIMARRILDDSSFRPVFITEYEGTNRPALPVYVFAIGAQLISRGIVGLRSVSAVAGILTVAGVFLLARELFGWRIGALSAFILAVMRWNLNFSRVAMEPIWSPFFAVMAIFFLVRGVRSGKWYEFALSGLFLGLGLQFYWAFLIWPLLYGLFTAHSFLLRQSAKVAPLAVGALLVILVGFAAYSPVAVYGYQHPDDYTRRSEQVSITKGKDWGQTVEAVKRTSRLHVLMFSSAGDRNGRHNLPNEPMLDTFTAIFFMLGIGMSLSRVWEPRHFLLLAWAVLALQPAVWSLEFEAPQGLRAILLTPAVAMLAALPLGALWAAVSSRRRQEEPEDKQSFGAAAARLLGLAWARDPLLLVAKVVVAGVLLFFLAQIAYRNYNTFFNKQLPNPSVWSEFSGALTLAGEELDRLAPDHDVRLASEFAGPTLTFLAPDVNVEGQRFDWSGDLPYTGTGPVAYLLETSMEALYKHVQALYPNAEFRRETPPGIPEPGVFFEAIVSAEQVQALQGLEALYTTASGESITRREPALDLDWAASPPGELPVQGVWTGALKVPAFSDYALTMEAPGPVRVFLDGQLLAEGASRVEGRATLYKGDHELRVEALVERPGRVRLTLNGQPVLPGMLFAHPLANHGLVASFYGNAEWEGEPVHRELDPIVGFRYHAELNVPSPFTARWEGVLEAPATGTYVLHVDANEEGWLVIDGEEIIEPGSIQAQIDLTAGRHQLELRYRNRGGFPFVYLYWTPPGQQTREVIPSSQLTPR